MIIDFIPTDFRYATTIVFWITIVIYLFFNQYKKYFNYVILICGVIGNFISMDWGKNILGLFGIHNLIEHVSILIVSIINFNINDPIYPVIIYYFLYLIFLRLFNKKGSNIYNKFNRITIIYFMYIIILYLTKKIN